jgi:hypothetical protein
MLQQILGLTRVTGFNLLILAVGVLLVEPTFGNWLSPTLLNRLNITCQIDPVEALRAE